ncbi:MAG: hypothetical protein ACP5QU_07120 [Anaerolineae bacterium]
MDRIGLGLPTQQDSQAPTLLQREWQDLLGNLENLLDCFFNFVFDLTLAGARRRFGTFLLILLALGLILGVSHNPASEWGEQLRKLFIYLLNPFAATTFGATYLQEFLRFAGQAFLAPQNVRYLFIILATMVIALETAASYQADIFEIPIHITRHFLWNVAFNGHGDKLIIREGEIVNRDSPVYRIGGPGRVVVELDSAALFEKANGIPHVIGPTVRQAVILDGFERFRQAIILREHQVVLREEDREISGRTLDGMRVSAIDVAIRYSIWRGDRQPTAETPFPYRDARTVESLIYQQVVSVSDHPQAQQKQNLFELQFTPLVRNELARFISQRKLTEFLASFGQPEIEKWRQQAQRLSAEIEKVVPAEQNDDPPAIPAQPPFAPRQEITALFHQRFAQTANERGFQLNWIGVGTWKTPVEIVPEQHQEAWRISLENLERGSEAALQQVEQEACAEKTLQLIQDVPLARFQENRRKNATYRETLRDLLMGYREHLKEYRELVKKKKADPTALIQAAMNYAAVEEAIGYLDEILGLSHWVIGGNY